MKIIRWILGAIILLLDRLFSPQSPSYTPEQQAKIKALSAPWVLYEFKACPFCVKVRRSLKRLGIALPIKDAGSDAKASEELVQGGGERQVPCLRIEEAPGRFRWLYESSDIIEFLHQKVALALKG